MGYLGLWLLEGRLPWRVSDMITVRSKLTLQALFGKYGGLFDFMVTVAKMSTEDMPNYNELCGMLQRQ